jgi:hypothetical protein
VFEDFSELKKNMDGSDDLTYDQVFDVLIKDLRSRGIPVDTPVDPLRDPQFIRTLIAAYDCGAPTSYPPEAPVTALYNHAA